MKRKFLPYKPAAPVKKIIMQLGDLLYYANAQTIGRWAYQNPPEREHGVYGHAYRTLKAVLLEELENESIVQAAMELLNLGGDKSFGHDILNAIQDAIDNANEAVGN